MHKPLQSVVAFAHFEFDQEKASHAQRMLDQVEDWQEWVNQVEAHGMSGFVNKHVDENCLILPSNILNLLRALKMRHAAASKARYKTLFRLDRAFASAGIQYLILKGAALMPRIYDAGYLRPMRDMDILVPRIHITKAATVLRAEGFDLPEEQPTKFMRDIHHLPNATLLVDGFTSSVELHHNALSRESPDRLYYPEELHDLQSLQIEEINFSALDDVLMLHQVSRHLEGLHNSAVLKLINVMDVIGLASEICQQGRWEEVKSKYPHVINTLRCLDLLTPLPTILRKQLEPMSKTTPDGIGQIMESLSSILIHKREGLPAKLKALLLPPNWWLHLHYNVDPDRSLLWVKLVRHPFKVSDWLSRRLYSWIRRG